MRKTEINLLMSAILSILFANANAAPVITAPTAAPAGTPMPTTPAPAPATPTPAKPAVNADGSIPMPASAGVVGGAPMPAAAPEPQIVKMSSDHGYVLAQGTINQPYGANPYRTLTVTVAPCDNGYSPYVSMSVGGVAGWPSHTIAEAWAVPTSTIKRDGSTYVVNYRAEARFYNGNWAWSSNVFVTWTMYCIPTDSFTYTPH